MSIRRLFLFSFVAIVFLLATGIPTKSQLPDPELGLFVGRNVNLAPYPQTIPGSTPEDPEEIVPYSGDQYLQRQNEPSMAVSTRNPMHLLAATNDYRTVYIPSSQGSLPGIELAAQTQDSGDAWVGIFKSYNGGQSWTTHLLPGYPQDTTAIGIASPLHVYEAACDPTVRAGSSGLFFVSGIGFDRIGSGSGIFIARYIDNNTQAIGETDTIEYLDVNMIDEGTSGQFADKPWIAVAAPTDSNDTVQIQTSHGIQEIPRFDVFIVYSIFLGGGTGEEHSKIMLAISSDSGNTWGRPIKLSESVHVCQGTNVVVSPYDGTIYVVWRQYSRGQQDVPDAIIMCKSSNKGRSFTKAKVFHVINPYDQFTYFEVPADPLVNRFRTSAFPAIAVDHNGLVYVAWSQLGVGVAPPDVPRIVIKTMDGKNVSDPTPIDDHTGRGHQIMPSLSYAGGVLTATWYDTRNSIPWNESSQINGEGQTMDVRAAQANPSTPNGTPLNPNFSDSVQVSRYLFYAETNEAGELVGQLGGTVGPGNPPIIWQANFNRPNLPLFDGGRSPFMGDYLDSAPSPMFLRDNVTGEWRFNTGEEQFDPSLFHIVFACNRDVIPPAEGLTWLHYFPPGIGGCLDDLTTGMRDQNVYTAPLTQGIQVYCPVNTKPLIFPPDSTVPPELQRRTFLVFVRNLTDSPKDIRLTIDAPDGMIASFWEFGPPVGTGEVCPPPFTSCTDTEVELPVLAHSSITLTVFVRVPYSPSDATLRVKVEDILTEFKTAIILNPDPVNTNLIDPADVLEYDAPFEIAEGYSEWDFDDVTLFSDEYVFTDEVLAQLLEASNPDVLAPSRRHPSRRHESILNPSRRHTSVYSAPDGQITDINWTVENTSTVTAAYSFDLLGETPSVPYQLLIYRVSSTHLAECTLSPEEHHELLLSYEDPDPLAPSRRHELQNPSRRHNTFFLAPGETAICTLRLMDPEPEPSSDPEVTIQSTQDPNSNGSSGGSFDPDFYSNTVTGAFTPQAADETGEIESTTGLFIINDFMPDGLVGNLYPDTLLEAEGGTGPYTWSLVQGYGVLPPGLTLDPLTGLISGTPTPDPPYENNEKTYYFAVQATDLEEQTANRSLSIIIISPNTAPVAYDQDVETNEDTFVEITLTASDAENDPLTYSVVSDTGPTYGTLSGNPPELIYTPDADYYGPDSFRFTANDGQVDSNEATVTIDVMPVNDPPSFIKGSEQTVLEDADAQSVVDWATDISAGPANEGLQKLDFIVDNDNNELFSGQPAITPNGTLIYTPGPDMNGSAMVTVQLHDDGGEDNGGKDTSAPQTFTITVTEVNDPPSFIKGDDQTVLEDAGTQSVVGWATSISAGPANESLQELHFIVDNNNNELFSGQPAITPDGTLTYTPGPDMNGSATMTVQLQDDGGRLNGGWDLSAPQTFTITIIAVPDPPVAVEDEYTLEKGTQPQKGKKTDYVLDVSADQGVLANDTDADGDSLTARIVTQPIRGGITFREDGSFRYRLNDEFVGDVTFTYEVSDSTGRTATATVTIHVVE